MYTLPSLSSTLLATIRHLLSGQVGGVFHVDSHVRFPGNGRRTGRVAARTEVEVFGRTLLLLWLFLGTCLLIVYHYGAGKRKSAVVSAVGLLLGTLYRLSHRLCVCVLPQKDN